MDDERARAARTFKKLDFGSGAHDTRAFLAYRRGRLYPRVNRPRVLDDEDHAREQQTSYDGLKHAIRSSNDHVEEDECKLAASKLSVREHNLINEKQAARVHDQSREQECRQQLEEREASTEHDDVGESNADGGEMRAKATPHLESRYDGGQRLAGRYHRERLGESLLDHLGGVLRVRQTNLQLRGPRAHTE